MTYRPSTFKNLWFFFMALILGLYLIATAPADAKRSRPATPASKETELKAVQDRINKVSQSIQVDAEKRDSLMGKLKDDDETIQSAREELADVKTRRLAMEQQLNSMLSERRATEQKVAAERSQLANEINIAYMNGRSEQLKILLNQQDPAQMGRMLAYYGYFAQERSQRITTINDHLAHINMLAERIEAQSAKLRAIENDQAKGVSSLAKAREKRANTLKQVEANLKNGNERLAKLQADARSLERLIEELRAAAEARAQAAGQSHSTVTGHGQWPWPVKGEVIAKFGQLRSGGPLKWEGLMIATADGAQVRAPAAGRVLYSDWLPGLGLLLVLDHGNGIMSLYGHNEQLFKKQGEDVKQGDLLAAVGDTGLNGRSGLYLEIRNGRQAVDPLKWLGKP
jgi:septal ring factor EnvC (AmiA/AmiB activator)